MSFLKDFNSLFNEILADWQNQFPEADISQGSLIYFKSACLASAVWGLYRYQEWISKQIFPDTADTENLDHHGWIHDLARKAGESDADYLSRLLSIIRQPPAGGNKQDYINWALEIQDVDKAYCFPLAQGLGTVDVVIVAVSGSAGDAGNGIPTQTLIDSVQNYIDGVRPVTANVSVQAPTILSQDVTMTVTGSDADTTQITTEIISYLNGFEPNQTLYVNQLIAIAIQNGADDATVTVPSGDVTPTNYQMIRAGTISVS